MEGPPLVAKLIFFSFCSAFLPSIVQWFVNSKQKKSSEEKQLISELRDMKRELSLISMVDEFAKHAKLQRKITKAQEELKTHANSRMIKSTKSKVITSQIVNGVLGVVLIYLVWMHRSEPVLFLPQGWLYPLEGIASWPTGQDGAISVTFWLLLSRTSIRILSGLKVN